MTSRHTRRVSAFVPRSNEQSLSFSCHPLLCRWRQNLRVFRTTTLYPQECQNNNLEQDDPNRFRNLLVTCPRNLPRHQVSQLHGSYRYRGHTEGSQGRCYLRSGGIRGNTDTPIVNSQIKGSGCSPGIGRIHNRVGSQASES